MIHITNIKMRRHKKVIVFKLCLQLFLTCTCILIEVYSVLFFILIITLLKKYSKIISINYLLNLQALTQCIKYLNKCIKIIKILLCKSFELMYTNHQTKIIVLEAKKLFEKMYIVRPKSLATS